MVIRKWVRSKVGIVVDGVEVEVDIETTAEFDDFGDIQCRAMRDMGFQFRCRTRACAVWTLYVVALAMSFFFVILDDSPITLCLEAVSVMYS